MLTLHKATDETKTILKWGSILIVSIILLLILINIGISLKEHFFPTPPQPPTVSFGKLPPINFGKNAAYKTLTYTINTLSGTLPVFPDRATVFKMTPAKSSLSSLQNTTAMVSQAGFTQNPIALSDTLYRWSSPTPPYKNITINIITHNFTLLSDFLSSGSAVFSAQNLGNENDAVITSQNFLQSLSLFPSDIDMNKTQTFLFSITNFGLKPASSLSEAQIIRVDFFQKDVNSLPIYYPHPPYSTMNDLVGSGDNQPQVVEAHFFHQEINQNMSATYPIASAAAAFSDLKQGRGYIASYYGKGTAVSIKNIFLAYYMSDTTQDYLMPIIVFKGDNGFFAYVSAVKDEWINK